jgi:arylsulfatase A-like enzyme
MKHILYLLGMIIGALLAGAASTPRVDSALSRDILPVPPVPYTNQIDVDWRSSTPQSNQPLSPPAGAPNVLLILLDDAGYGQTSTFGSPISTPTLDRLAAHGLRYTRFHVTAICSPSRAALLTGRNSHSVGMGAVVQNSSDFPGYDGRIPKSAAFISETLRLNGYSTAAFGKWHLTPTAEMGPSGPFDRWPTGQGFDYFYGFLIGHASQWNPVLFEGTKPVTMQVPEGRQADYTLNEDMANKAIAWIQRVKSVEPARPFFAYYAPGATHAPLHAPQAWIDQFKGQFDMGWDRYREIVFQRQKELGVIPPDTELTPRPPEIPSWDSLSADERKISARLMEVFAGYLAQTDHEIGRIVDAIEASGQLDNTLIFYIAGDNGTSLQGGLTGIFNTTVHQNKVHEDPAELVQRLDELGSATSSPQYPVGWAWAGNTPFQWGKHIASHLGGTRDPLVVSWPAQIKDAGGLRSQFHHLIDVVPTILEAAQLPEPRSVNGVSQKPVEGVSMAYSFAEGETSERRTTQYFELYANRSIYHEGWMAVARSGKLPWMASGGEDFADQTWELYNLNEDYSERRDLAGAYPDRLRELQELFLSEAHKYQVLPMDWRSSGRSEAEDAVTLNDGLPRFTYYGAPLHLYSNLAPPVRNRSFTISADIQVPELDVDGVIVAEGGQFGGYSLFVTDGRINFTYNFLGKEKTTLRANEKLPVGSVNIGFRFDYEEGGRGKGGNATLLVDGKVQSTQHIRRTHPSGFEQYDRFDIGEDSGTQVGDYDRPFRFTGVIHKVVIDTAPDSSAPAQPNSLIPTQSKTDH